jgi:hypothetical protein
MVKSRDSPDLQIEEGNGTEGGISDLGFTGACAIFNFAIGALWRQSLHDNGRTVRSRTPCHVRRSRARVRSVRTGLRGNLWSHDSAC